MSMLGHPWGFRVLTPRIVAALREYAVFQAAGLTCRGEKCYIILGYCIAGHAIYSFTTTFAQFLCKSCYFSYVHISDWELVYPGLFGSVCPQYNVSQLS